MGHLTKLEAKKRQLSSAEAQSLLKKEVNIVWSISRLQHEVLELYGAGLSLYVIKCTLQFKSTQRE